MKAGIIIGPSPELFLGTSTDSTAAAALLGTMTQRLEPFCAEDDELDVEVPGEVTLAGGVEVSSCAKRERLKFANLLL